METYHLNPVGHSQLAIAVTTYISALLPPSGNAPIAPTPLPTRSPTPIPTPGPTLAPASSPTPTPATFCSGSPDRIELDAYATRGYDCAVTAYQPVRFLWRTAGINQEGFRDDEYFVRAFQNEPSSGEFFQIYSSGHIESLVGTSGSSGLVGVGSRDDLYSFRAQFECNLEVSFLHCDDGTFEFKFVSCGCPGGLAPIQPCIAGSLETAQDAICQPYEPVPTQAPTTEPIASSGDFCFSERATVQVLAADGATVKEVAMPGLQVGDRVMTKQLDSNEPVFTSVYAFAHRHETQLVNYIQIFTNSNYTTAPLEVTAKHMVFVRGMTGPVRADSIQTGDVLTGDVLTERLVVTRVLSVQRRGLYSPLTQTGTILVDGILASTYAAVQSHQHEHVIFRAGHGDGLSLPWLNQAKIVHLWLSPLRLTCQFVSAKHCHDLQADGMLTFVAFGFKVVTWAQSQHVILQMAVLITNLLVTGIFYGVEMLLETTLRSSAVGVALVAVVLFGRRARYTLEKS